MEERKKKKQRKIEIIAADVDHIGTVTDKYHDKFS
jgi:hypothetical protein